MRLLALLVTLAIVACLIYVQLGSSGSSPAEQAAYEQAEANTTAVDVLVRDQFVRQAGQLSRMEGSEQP